MFYNVLQKCSQCVTIMCSKSVRIVFYNVLQKCSAMRSKEKIQQISQQNTFGNGSGTLFKIIFTTERIWNTIRTQYLGKCAKYVPNVFPEFAVYLYINSRSILLLILITFVQLYCNLNSTKTKLLIRLQMISTFSFMFLATLQNFIF